MAHGSIGRLQGAGLLATTLLGTGVFILPGLTLSTAGGAAFWLWIVLTLLAVPVTLVFGQLAGSLPHAGGPAHFVQVAFGEIAGRVTGLLFLLVVPVGAAAALWMAWSFIEPWFGGAPWHALLAQYGFLGLFYLLNRVGFQLSAKLQLTLTLAIAFAVVLLGVLAWPQLHGVTPALPVMADAPALSTAIALGFWSFLGVEAMTHLAQDFKQPQRDMVPALLLGLAVVGVLYLLCTWLLWQLSPNPTAPLSMAEAFGLVLGPVGTVLIAALGLASSLAGVNVYTASVARLCGSFAEQGVLPRGLATKNAHQVPERALVFMLLLMALLITGATLSGQQLADLISWVNGVFVFIYLAAMAAALRLLPRRFKPIALLSLLLCVAVLWTLGSSIGYAVLLVLVCTPCVWWQHARRAASVIADTSAAP
ncbi:MAG TPA: L-methionine/branched-chain amino acid transporter [Rheinheimera sp.]|nr:L-methionine/branched-chain amino acid transporter [Rheinheimera sp.]